MQYLWTVVVWTAACLTFVATSPKHGARPVRAIEAVAVAERCTVEANGVETCNDVVQRFTFDRRVRSVTFTTEPLYNEPPTLMCWAGSDIERKCGIPVGTPGPMAGETTIVMSCSGEIPEAGCGFIICEVTNAREVDYHTEIATR